MTTPDPMTPALQATLDAVPGSTTPAQRLRAAIHNRVDGEALLVRRGLDLSVGGLLALLEGGEDEVHRRRVFLGCHVGVCVCAGVRFAGSPGKWRGRMRRSKSPFNTEAVRKRL
jgi:hypothetical protein